MNNKKVFSLKELKEMAKPKFEKLGVNKLYATNDGQFFLLANRAELHAGKALAVYPIENDAPPVEPVADDETDQTKPLSVKELTASIKGETSLDVLKQLLLDEVAGMNRSSATKAIEARIQVLNDAAGAGEKVDSKEATGEKK